MFPVSDLDSRNNSRTNLVSFQGLGIDVVNYLTTNVGDSEKGEGGWILRRCALQRALEELLPESRAALVCFKRPLVRFSPPSLVRKVNRVGKEYLSYEGLSRCGNVWVCPHCSPRVSEVRRKEIEQAVRSWRGERYGVARDASYSSLSGKELRLILFTVPHQRFDSLGSLLDRFKKAFDWMKKGKLYRLFCSDFKLFGTITVSEVTYGLHGWHPHIHAIWFFDTAEVNDGKLSEELFKLWRDAAKRFELGDLSLEGFGIKDADFVSAYLTKYGRPSQSRWYVEQELSKWYLKKGKEGSYTPFDLLEAALVNLYFQTGYSAAVSSSPGGALETLGSKPSLLKESGKLFLEFAKAFKGRHQIQWSRGLKKYFGLAEVKDEEAVMEEGNVGQMLYHFTLEEWDEIVRRGSRYEFLNLTEMRLKEGGNADKGLRGWGAVPKVYSRSTEETVPKVYSRSTEETVPKSI